jgi:diguanylate cyclase (GGDEF)-like protein
MKNRISLLKIINIFALLLFIIFISYIFVDFKTIFKTLEDIQKSKIEEYIKAKNSVFVPLIKYHFYDELTEELNKLNKDIKYIKIITKDYTYKKGKKTDLKLIEIPLTDKNKKIGKIIVGYDDKKFLNKFSEKYFKKVIIYIIILLLIFLFAFNYIKLKISSLNRLAKKIEKINFKKIKKVELLDSYYEIRNITHSINKLLRQINTFYNYQLKLLKRIIFYKKQLETAQKIADMFTWEYNCEKNIFLSQNFHIKKKLGFKDINEFVNSLNNKEIFIKEIERACKEQYEFELLLKIKNKENKEFYFKVRGKTIFRDGKNYPIGTFINVTEEVKKQEQIEYLAYHDSLTGLLNRTALKEELKILMNLANRNNEKIALVFIDLDNFKYINDTFGHEIGDIFLIEVSERLKQVIRKSDLISRIGGDEFVLVLNNIKKVNDIEKIMQKINDIFKKPFLVKIQKLDITFSAGIAIYPDDSIKIEDLLKYADIAMYESKKRGKNRYSFITKDLKDGIKEYYTILNELKEALKKDNELILYYQPKIDVINKKVVGVEALIRWNHPKKGILSPFYFIDIAEKANLISHIDDYVLEKGIKTIKNWEKNSSLKHLEIAINISANKFNEKNFVKQLKDLIDKYKINPAKLQIEITETLSMENIYHTINVLNDIKALGIKIALDDFGTGYSSLHYLKKIPFDVLKIDQSFVKDVLIDKDDLTITKMIIEISKILNKINVAEGVENEKILQIMTNLGASIIQGYYFSKPISENELKEYIVNFDYKNYI